MMVFSSREQSNVCIVITAFLVLRSLGCFPHLFVLRRHVFRSKVCFLSLSILVVQMNVFSGPLDLYLIIALKQNQVLLM